MAVLNTAFNAETVDPTMRGEFALIPDGVYEMEISASDYGPNSKGNGSVLKLTYRVISGDHEGALVWSNLNIENPSAQAVEIATREFSALCHATGELSVSDSEQLHFKPFFAKVVTEPAKGDYKAKNKISVVYWEGAPDQAPPPAATAARAPATPKETPKAAVVAAVAAKPAGARPWAKK